MTTATKFYLTRQGLREVQDEHERLLAFRNAKVQEEVPSTLHSEDINPDYLAFKEDMNMLEDKIVEVETIIQNAALIAPPPKQERNMVHLGATVVVEVDGARDEFEIVGTVEANPSRGRISNESPVGKLLLGAGIGDMVEVAFPIKTVYKIVEIMYKVKY
ncbi:MAG: GreA/GreB family elongation factor [Candidatus Wildermuthbacteria bacterium]|nr:GreA/GreB family elongation factor [Candidatus Wildermuthbacteria bacterium]